MELSELNTSMMFNVFRLIKNELKENGWRGYITSNYHRKSDDEELGVWKLINDKHKLVVFVNYDVNLKKMDWGKVRIKDLEMFVNKVQDLVLHNMELEILNSKHILNLDTMGYGMLRISNFEEFVGLRDSAVHEVVAKRETDAHNHTLA